LHFAALPYCHLARTALECREEEIPIPNLLRSLKEIASMDWFFFQGVLSPYAAVVSATLLAAAFSPAHAVDGCKVVLCLGGNWRSIPTCIPDVRWALRHGIPSCAGMGFSWAGPGNCPPQYSIEAPGIDGPTLACRMTSAISVLRGNQVWQQVWWSEPEQIYRIWYSDDARREIVDIDPTWDNDYATWIEQQEQQQDRLGNGGGH
jgi:hypothetical protein